MISNNQLFTKVFITNLLLLPYNNSNQQNGLMMYMIIGFFLLNIGNVIILYVAYQCKRIYLNNKMDLNLLNCMSN